MAIYYMLYNCLMIFCILSSLPLLLSLFLILTTSKKLTTIINTAPQMENILFITFRLKDGLNLFTWLSTSLNVRVPQRASKDSPAFSSHPQSSWLHSLSHPSPKAFLLCPQLPTVRCPYFHPDFLYIVLTVNLLGTPGTHIGNQPFQVPGQLFLFHVPDNITSSDQAGFIYH